MKVFAHFEVIGLYDDSGSGRSGFADLLTDEKAVYRSLQLTPDMFQPGTQIVVKIAQCPACERPTTDHVQGICPCGHNWIEWCQEKYSDYQPGQQADEEEGQAKAG